MIKWVSEKSAEILETSAKIDADQQAIEDLERAKANLTTDKDVEAPQQKEAVEAGKTGVTGIPNALGSDAKKAKELKPVLEVIKHYADVLDKAGDLLVSEQTAKALDKKIEALKLDKAKLDGEYVSSVGAFISALLAWQSTPEGNRGTASQAPTASPVAPNASAPSPRSPEGRPGGGAGTSDARGAAVEAHGGGGGKPNDGGGGGGSPGGLRGGGGTSSSGGGGGNKPAGDQGSVKMGEPK
jgi:hypothetical protein